MMGDGGGGSSAHAVRGTPKQVTPTTQGESFCNLKKMSKLHPVVEEVLRGGRDGSGPPVIDFAPRQMTWPRAF
jgi:hypothetical protein